ncbi:MAG TPA: FAD-binding oxidoreductase [Ktedonobacterales bacterium]|jgi:glycine/D-amino acid oxidase-like deaminating enzyme
MAPGSASPQRNRSGSVIIIGGGSTAALSAVRLAEQGFQVTVLEKARRGNGSSSRSAAGIRAQFGVEETIIGMRYSEWWYAHFHDHLQTPPERRHPVMRQNGYLFLYEDPPQAENHALRLEAASAWQRAQKDAAMQRRLGHPVELLTPTQAQERWPHLDAERLIGAAWCAEDGFLIPDMIYGEGFRRAQELGVTIREQTEVLGAAIQGERIVALQTSAGKLEADWIVNATNAWAPRVSKRLQGMDLAISPQKRYLYFWKPTQPIMEQERWRQLPMTIYGMGKGRGAHSRPEGELLLLAWARETPPEPDFTDADQDAIRPGFSHREGVENFGYAVLEQAAAFAPRLVDAGGLVATTSGFYGMTPDANPLIGFDTRLANLVHAAGFSGHGLMHAPITATLVAALISGSIKNGQAQLLPPFEAYSINLATFDPGRDFSRSHKETHVL